MTSFVEAPAAMSALRAALLLLGCLMVGGCSGAHWREGKVHPDYKSPERLVIVLSAEEGGEAALVPLRYAIARALRDRGITPRFVPPDGEGSVAEVAVVRWDRGSRAARYWVSFGAGRAEIYVTVRSPSASGGEGILGYAKGWVSGGWFGGEDRNAIRSVGSLIADAIATGNVRVDPMRKSKGKSMLPPRQGRSRSPVVKQTPPSPASAAAVQAATSALASRPAAERVVTALLPLGEIGLHLQGDAAQSRTHVWLVLRAPRESLAQVPCHPTLAGGGWTSGDFAVTRARTEFHYRRRIAVSDLLVLAKATDVQGRMCELEFSIGDTQRSGIMDFIVRFTNVSSPSS